MGTDIDVNTNDLARRVPRIKAIHYIQEAQQRGRESQGTTMGNSCLKN